jgi:hypothetical protein
VRDAPRVLGEAFIGAGWRGVAWGGGETASDGLELQWWLVMGRGSGSGSGG